MPWRSAGKPLTAVAIGQFWEQGFLEVDDLLSTHIPEFGGRIKEPITLRHLLTHTSGLPAHDIDWYRTPWTQIIAKICFEDYPAGVIPGAQAAYVPYGTWFLLGEILRRCDARKLHGQDQVALRRGVDQIIDEMIFQPLGMTRSFVGIPLPQQHSLGSLVSRMVETGPAAGGQVKVASWDNPLRTAAVNPAGNARGSMGDLGAFYQSMLDHGWNRDRSNRILRGPTVEALTARQREGMMDSVMRHHMDWGLGFIVDSNRYGTETVPYGHGRHSSSRTFGHGGMQCCCGFADPLNQVVVAVSFAGLPGEPRHNARVRNFASAVYEDLNLAISTQLGEV
jgi:CubicO group peptidase (beta-lactamase class C family)